MTVRLVKISNITRIISTAQFPHEEFLLNYICDFIIISVNIEIRNIGAKHQKPLDKFGCEGAVIYISDSSNININGCDINGCGSIGVSADFTSKLLINYCTIHDNTFCALLFNDCSNVEVFENTIINNNETMILYNCKSLKMYGNKIKDNGDAFSNNPDL